MSDNFPTFREWWGEDMPDMSDDELLEALRGTLLYERYDLAKRKHAAYQELDKARGPILSRLARWLRRLGV